MRSLAIALLTLIMVNSTVLGGDHIRINVDKIPTDTVAYKLEFFVDRTCPTPGWISDIFNAFALNATGTAEFQLAGFSPDPEVVEWFFFGTDTSERLFSFGHDLPTTWGSAGMFWIRCWTTVGGLPVLEAEHKLFDLYLDVRGEGEILIDSAYVPTGGYWYWRDLTCGLGGAPNRPLFVAKDGGDLIHPIHITVFEPCGDANLDAAVDIDDVIHIGMYIFAGGPAPDLWRAADPDCSGQIDIDDVVYLLNYIFGKSSAPCDPDGDGVPDC